MLKVSLKDIKSTGKIGVTYPSGFCILEAKSSNKYRLHPGSRIRLGTNC